MSPILGAMADAAGPRKPFIGFFLLGVSFGWLLTGQGDGIDPPDTVQELTPRRPGHFA